MRFVVVGCTTVDVLAGGLAQLPTVRAGDEFTPQTLVELPAPPAFTIGGNGGNAAYVLGRLGRRAVVVSCLGDDMLGRQATGWLGGAGVELVRVPPDRTSCNLVATDLDGNRYSFFHPVAFDEPALVGAVRVVALGGGDHLHLAGFPHPAYRTLRQLLDEAAAAGASASLDIGPALAGFRLGPVLDLADRLDVLFATHEELTGLDPAAEPEAVARRLAGRVRAAVVVKGGASGARALGPGGPEGRIATVEVMPRPVTAAATVGAGDAFDAGFLAARRAGADLERSLAAGDAVAREVLMRGRGVLAAPIPGDLPPDLLPETSGQPDVPGKDH